MAGIVDYPHRKGRLRYQLVGDDAHEAAATKLREEK